LCLWSNVGEYQIHAHTIRSGFARSAGLRGSLQREDEGGRRIAAARKFRETAINAQGRFLAVDLWSLLIGQI